MPVKEIISLLESDDGDLSVWNDADDDDDDDALMSGKVCLGNSCQELFDPRRPWGSWSGGRGFTWAKVYNKNGRVVPFLL